MTDPRTTATTPQTTPLRRLGVLAIDGPDAVTFLQGQATCDCRQLNAQRGALGALCNLQGRMIVSFYVLAVADGLRLLLPRDRLAAVLTHLKKYAVFSKVVLRDDSEAYVLLGHLDDNSGADAFAVSGDTAPGPLLHLRGQRALQLLPVDAGATRRDDPDNSTPDNSTRDTGTRDNNDADDNAWRAAAIAAGELLVDTANADKFLPQALNYDIIDGVNFRKGCYTGQEVVARMHFKGRMKERLYVMHAAGGDAIAPATPVVTADGRTVGEVVDAARVAGGFLLGAVIRHDAVAAGGLRTGGPRPGDQESAAATVMLETAAAPYPLPDLDPGATG